MAPLPPAPSLPDLGEVLRKATEEVIKLGSALARKDEGKHWLQFSFAFLGLMASCSIEEAPAKAKRDRKHSPLFVEQDDAPKVSTGAARTTISSGPYAGLRSATKRVRETGDPQGHPRPSFGPPKKVRKKYDALQNV